MTTSQEPGGASRVSEPTVQVPVSLIERLLGNRTTDDLAELRALFSQPTPSAEPTVVLRIEQELEYRVRTAVARWKAADHDGSDTAAVVNEEVRGGRAAVRAHLLQPSATEPVSIADMAPGTTFRMRRNGESTWHLWCWTGNALMRIGDRVTVQGEISQMDVDPSTIRDVTPPTESTK